MLVNRNLRQDIMRVGEMRMLRWLSGNTLEDGIRNNFFNLEV